MPDNQPNIDLNQGLSMPQLGLGVWQTPAEETAAIVRAALEAGYRSIDTAAIYGNEEGVGEALDGRDDIFLTTKVWNSDQGYDATLRAFEASARKLRRETIDLYLVHWPAPSKGLYGETWRALVQLKEEGRARAIGVSNFHEEHLERIIGDSGVTPAVNQIELHPRFQQSALRDFHAAHGIATEAWSPLGQGQVLQDPVIDRLARKHGRTPAQIVIRWHLDNGIIVIPKSANPGRLRENFQVFDFVLDEEDLAAIGDLDAADGRIGPDPRTAAF